MIIILKKFQNKDLTKDSIMKIILITAIPTMIGFGSQMLFDLVDIFWIGKISSDALAAVTIFSTIFWVIMAFNEIIGVSSISLIAQNYGRKDYDRTSLCIEQTIIFKALVAVAAAIFLAIFLKPFTMFFTDDPEIVKFVMDYGYIRLFFLPIMFTSYSVNTSLRCIGDAMTPMIIMVLTSITNIIMDPFFIFDTIPNTNINGLGLGVFGAALATVFSQTIASFIGLYILFKGKRNIKLDIKRLFKLIPEIDKKLITIGLPNGFEVFLRNIFQVIVLKFVAIFGTEAVAATGVAGRIFGFAFMPLIGLSMSGSALIGQSLGDDNVERSEKAANLTGILGALILGAFTLFAIFSGGSVIKIFSQDSLVIDYGSQFLVYGSIGLIFIAYGVGYSSAFSGAGYNKPIFISSVLSRWGVQIPFLIITVSILNLPIIWVWLAYLFGDLADYLVKLYYYKKGDWKFRRV